MGRNNLLASPTIPRFDFALAKERPPGKQWFEKLVSAIDENGVVLIEHALEPHQTDAIVSEMRPFIETTPHGLHGLDNSRRVGALVARSPASHAAIEHPAVVNICEAVLGEQRLAGSKVNMTQAPKGEGRYPWRLSLTQIIDVGPGQERQGIHCGNGLWVHDLAGAGFHPQIETMWALSDFTKENGATHVAIGSHKWVDQRDADSARGTTTWHGLPNVNTVQATMPKGSVLVWTGWTVHGAGENRTSERRIGMNIDYSLSFLSQEENQFLACPPAQARHLSESMRRLIGYTQGGVALNYFADCLRPKEALREGYDVMVPGSHGMENPLSTDSSEPT